MGKVFLLFVVLLYFSLPPIIHGAQVGTRLEGIKKEIEKEKQGITKVQRKEVSILKELEKIEKALDTRKMELKRMNSKLETILAALQNKEKQAKQLKLSLNERRDLLEKRALALYKWQRGGSPFILFNGSVSVAELVQRKRYLELMLAYDHELVSYLRSESKRQEALKKKLSQRRGEVNKQRRAIVRVKESIRLEKRKKKKVLSNLRRKKKTHTRALKELKQAAVRLQKMMEEISRRSVVKAKGLPRGMNFEKMKGRLDYPVRGMVMGEFGKRRHPEFSGELFRKGIDIEAPLGEEIRAVDGGKIVFANRYSGYGKMMIVDHGQRYYTIYAHLSDLLKKTGEPVQRGEPIALVGDSGSLNGTRLYFEIRKDGKALNPIPWFKKP